MQKSTICVLMMREAVKFLRSLFVRVTDSTFSSNDRHSPEVLHAFFQRPHHIPDNFASPVLFSVCYAREAPLDSCRIVISTFAAHAAGPRQRSHYVEGMFSCGIGS
jgi:hypothetical protein